MTAYSGHPWIGEGWVHVCFNGNIANARLDAYRYRLGAHRIRAHPAQHLQAFRYGATLRLPSTQQEEVMTMIVVAAASAGSTRV